MNFANLLSESVIGFRYMVILPTVECGPFGEVWIRKFLTLQPINSSGSIRVTLAGFEVSQGILLVSLMSGMVSNHVPV